MSQNGKLIYLYFTFQENQCSFGGGVHVVNIFMFYSYNRVILKLFIIILSIIDNVTSFLCQCPLCSISAFGVAQDRVTITFGFKKDKHEALKSIKL